MTALPGKKDYSNVYRLIFAWFFILSSVYLSISCALEFNIFKALRNAKEITEEDIAYTLKAHPEYTREQLLEKLLKIKK
jgi:hypothetical protein